MPLKVSVIVPTYNEQDSITPLIQRIGSTLTGYDYEIVVVDDNSPDGTAEVAHSLSQSYPVKVIKRQGKLGLASAITAGFTTADSDIVGVIDADLQHPPEVIRDLVAAIEQGCDIAIASRYVPGGGVENWSLFRKVVSKGASLLARPLTKVKDPMSGCFFLSKKVIQGGGFTCGGYGILLEILAGGNYGKVKEIPYVFHKRQAGESKLGIKEYVRYLKLLYHLYLAKLKGT